MRPRRPHADLWRRLSVAVQARTERGLTSAIRWVPAHLTWEEALAGDKITVPDWQGNTKADAKARDALLMQPDNTARAEAIDRFDQYTLGALKIGVAVYSKVVQHREAEGAPPPKRNRNRAPQAPRQRERQWPWEVRGHHIVPDGSGWTCTKCNNHPGTKGSLSVFAKTSCHEGRTLWTSGEEGKVRRQEISDNANAVKWRKRAHAELLQARDRGEDPTVHRPVKLARFFLGL